MSDIAIRPYELIDRVAVSRLWNEVFPNPLPHNVPEEAIDRFIYADAGVFFVASVGDRVVGTALGGYDGHRGWIYSLAVDSLYRRQGIGSKLVLATEASLTERGCKKINLQVRSDNDAVAGFYKQLGFTVEERISMGKLVG
ncbi:MAG: GNAT family acetyltransferase [Planctomycetota bacterium]